MQVGALTSGAAKQARVPARLKKGPGDLNGARPHIRALLLGAVVAALWLPGAAQARKWPRPPAWWLPGAWCVHRHESVDFHIHNDPYANGWQFMLGTWENAGGAASTWITASPAEQLYRVWIVYSRDRRTGDHDGWREWPNTARACGLR
jgi:hypothetical protein